MIKSSLLIFLALNIISCGNKQDVDIKYNNGSVKEIFIANKNDSQDMVGIDFYPNGRIKEIRYAKNNEFNGPRYFFSDSGNYFEQGAYLNGKRDGTWIVVSDGKTLMKNTYNQGKSVLSIGMENRGNRVDTVSIVTPEKIIHYSPFGKIRWIACKDDTTIIGEISADKNGKLESKKGQLPCLTKRDSINLGLE